MKAFSLYTFFLKKSAVDIFLDLGVMLAVFEQPEMYHSKTRDQSMLFFSTNNFFDVICVQV